MAASCRSAQRQETELTPIVSGGHRRHSTFPRDLFSGATGAYDRRMSDSSLPPAPSPTPSTPARVVSDAVLQQIDREMDAAFVKNIAKNKRIQDERKLARKAQAASMAPPIEEIGPDTPISLDEEPCTPQDTSTTTPGPLRMQGRTNEDRVAPFVERMLQEARLAAEQNRPRQTQRVPSAGATQLTPQLRAELEAESRALIAELKQFMSDPGNYGVPDSVFVAGWDGVRLKPPRI